MATAVLPEAELPRDARVAASTATDAMARGLAVAALCCSGAVALGSLLAVCLRWFLHWGPLSYGLSLVVLHELMVVGVLVARRRDPRLALACGVPLVAGVAMMMPWRSGMDPANLWAPGYWGLPWATLMMTCLPRRTYLWLISSVFSLLMVADLAVQWAVRAPINRITLEATPGIVSPVALLVLFCDGLLELARRTDRAVARRDLAERAREQESVRAESGREIARLVHDHVLHALHAVTSLGAGVDRELVVEECRTAASVLDDHLANAPGDADLSALLAADPALAAAGAELVGQAPPLPAGVARTLAAAAHEALVNVARHASASTCTVELEQTRGVWRCTVRDDGVGFSTSRVSANRLGLRRSVTERLAQAGGIAEVSSAPGQGTVVELRWPAEPVVPVPADVAREARLVLTRTAWPNLFLAPVFTALLYPLCHPEWPPIVACLVLLAVGALLIRRFEDHAPRPWEVLLAMGTSTAVWGANLLAAPHHVTSVHPLWLCWGCAALVHLVVLQVSWRRGVASLAGWGAIIVGLMVWRYGSDIDWVRMHPIVSVGACEGLISLLAFHVGQALTLRAAQQHLVERREQREALRLRLEGQVDEFWTRSVTQKALGLMHEVAAGRELDDPTLPRRAAEVEAALRDELVLGAGHRELLSALARLRGAGWVLSSSLSPESGEGALELVVPLLDQLGAPAGPGQQVVLSAARGVATAVVLEPSVAQAARWSDTPGHTAIAGEFARLTARVGREDGDADA